MGFWFSLFMFAFTTILSEVLRPKPKFEQAKPAGIGDFNFPTATEARALSWLFGTIRIKGPNTAWWGDLKATPIIEEVSTGLISSQDVTKGHEYGIGWQSILCAGGEFPVDELVGVWIGDDKVFTGNVADGGTFTINEPRLFGDPDEGGNGGVVGTFRFFAGSNSQAVSTYLSTQIVTAAALNAGGITYSVGDVLTAVGGTFTQAASIRVDTVSGGVVTAVSLISGGLYTAFPTNPVATTASPDDGSGCTIDLTFGTGFQVEDGDTPAYRGFCYVVNDTERAYVGNSPNIKPWSYELRRTPNPVGVASGKHVVNGWDANPVNVIYIALTSIEGMGFDPATIDTANFASVGTTLADEGNGFSMLIDRVEDVGDLIERVERQIDGLIVFSESAQLWRIVLARADYTPGTLPEINETNILEVRNFTRGSWEGTTNQVRLQYNDRPDDYKRTAALAQDMANIAIQGGVVISATESHPGVKDGDLATSIVWRSLRTLAYPLAQMTVTVNRTFWDAQPNDVYEVTHSRLSLTRLPMRVQRVDRGELVDGKITIDLVQDVFYAAAGIFAPPTGTGWQPPSENLVPFPADQQLAMEAPRGLVARDPSSPTPDLDKVYVAARAQGVESSFEIRERNAAGTPSGAFTASGKVSKFALVGELNAALPAGSATPTTSIIMTPLPDTQTVLEAAFPDVTDPVQLGTELLTLIFIGNETGGEFMLVSSAQTNAGNVQLNNVYRGILDSVQQDHLINTKVFLIFVGGGMSSGTIPAGNNVHVKLIPKSLLGELTEANAIQITLDFDDRVRRPYAPSEMDVGGTRFATTASLESAGSVEGIGIGLDFIRRSFRTTDEVEALTVDAGTLFADYPAEHSTEHDVDVRNDPDGANTFLFNDDLASANSVVVRRLDVLQQTAGVLPTRLRFALRSSHTFSGTGYDSLADLVWDFNLTSELSGKFNFGALDTNITSNAYTVVDDTQDHDFVLSTSFTAGNVQYQINGGGWLTLITAGGTTGAISAASLTNGDSVEIRHGSADAGAQKLIKMNLGATLTGYAVLYV